MDPARRHGRNGEFLMAGFILAAIVSAVFVDITGAPPFPPMPDSVQITDAGISALRDNALGWYLEEGYPFASLALYFPSGDTLTVNTIPGRHALLEEVRFPDSVRTARSILLRELALMPGDLYNPEPVSDWITALERYQFIESAGPCGVALGPGGNIVLLVPVEETPPGWFSGDLDFSSSGGFTGGGEIILANVFGTGRRLELSAYAVEWGGVDASGLYREPWILGSPLSVQLEIEQQVPDSGSVVREWSGSLILGLGNIDVSGGGGVWKSWPLNSAVESFRYGSAGITWDFTHRRTQGREGYSGTLTTEAGTASGPDSSYLLTRAFTRVEYTLFKGMLGFHMNAQAGGIVSGDWLPTMVTRIGGYSTLRGYARDSFRAGAWAVASPEVSLGETPTRVYVFSDIGILNTGDTGMKYPVSTGIGIRGTTGTLRFDAGSGFPTDKGVGSARFYLSAAVSL
jgi:hypothetical protein